MTSLGHTRDEAVVSQCWCGGKGGARSNKAAFFIKRIFISHFFGQSRRRVRTLVAESCGRPFWTVTLA